MGSLLRIKVCFKKGDTYGEIIEKYVNIVEKYPNGVSVFDGYDNVTSTKYISHLKRSRKVMTSPTVQLDLHLPFTCDSKDAFFANKVNKKAFYQTTFLHSKRQKHFSTSGQR